MLAKECDMLNRAPLQLPSRKYGIEKVYRPGPTTVATVDQTRFAQIGGLSIDSSLVARQPSHHHMAKGIEQLFCIISLSKNNIGMNKGNYVRK